MVKYEHYQCQWSVKACEPLVAIFGYVTAVVAPKLLSPCPVLVSPLIGRASEACTAATGAQY